MTPVSYEFVLPLLTTLYRILIFRHYFSEGNLIDKDDEESIINKYVDKNLIDSIAWDSY